MEDIGEWTNGQDGNNLSNSKSQSGAVSEVETAMEVVSSQDVQTNYVVGIIVATLLVPLAIQFLVTRPNMLKIREWLEVRERHNIQRWQRCKGQDQKMRIDY